MNAWPFLVKMLANFAVFVFILFFFIALAIALTCVQRTDKREARAKEAALQASRPASIRRSRSLESKCHCPPPHTVCCNNTTIPAKTLHEWKLELDRIVKHTSTIKEEIEMVQIPARFHNVDAAGHSALKCYFNQEVAGEPDANFQCEGDQCGAFGNAAGAWRQARSSLVDIAVLFVTERKLELDNLTILFMTPHQCTGWHCDLVKPFDSDTIGYSCTNFSVKFAAFRTYFPNTVFLFGMVPYFWKPKANLKVFEEIISQNCEQRFNNSLAAFPITSRPLVKCLLFIQPSGNTTLERVCMGHFCYLLEIIGWRSIPTQYDRGCWRVDDRNATRKVSIINKNAGFGIAQSLPFCYFLLSLFLLINNRGFGVTVLLVCLAFIGPSRGIKCHYSEEIGDETTMQCIGDRCAAFGVDEGVMRQFCLVNIAAYDGVADGCYRGYYDYHHCLCSSDLCNTNEMLVSTPLIYINSTLRCFVGMGKDECYGQKYCDFTKPHDDVMDYWCKNFTVLSTKFTNYFPNVVFLITNSLSYKSWDLKDTTSPVEIFDQDFSCSGENCEQRFNKTIANFPTASKPLIKCHLIAHPIKVFVWESSAAIERTCVGHFCYLQEIRGYDDIPTQVITGCLRVDDRNASRKVIPTTLVSGFETLYICNKDFCNWNKTTAGKGGLEVVNTASSRQTFPCILDPMVALRNTWMDTYAARLFCKQLKLTTDFCNTESILSTPLKNSTLRTQKPQPSARACSHISHDFYSKEIAYSCSAFDVTYISEFDLFPNVVVKNVYGSQYYLWNKSDNVSMIEPLSSDMSCSGADCERLFNQSLANFRLSLRPLVKCFLRWEIGSIKRLCLGHYWQ
ncbi:hypothetical protein PRIPAC_89498 [Pristionchus pacificus]|uniref:DUF7622 domain-containing protein n=1 Tax=Pristionchus pacificus TaxID=54126 RepID=A0A2A6B6I4_PRIPA|nr:hypothetical protein PRIPAC_89498 [Pristionchus pacificus]|eukprot:PDM61499.1 hypothetical protein PRIPAC_50941 [Pristionchus pacificus]